MTSFLPDMFGLAGGFFGTFFHPGSIHIHTIWGPITMDTNQFFHGFFGFFR